MSAEINGSLVKLNGIISQGENIADNGGFKESYRCALSMYIFYLQRHKHWGGGLGPHPLISEIYVFKGVSKPNVCLLERKKNLTPHPLYSPHRKSMNFPRAYERLIEEEGEELSLPGLPYTPRQLFWLSGASAWCSVYRDDWMKNVLLTQVHPPGRYLYQMILFSIKSHEIPPPLPKKKMIGG